MFDKHGSGSVVPRDKFDLAAANAAAGAGWPAIEPCSQRLLQWVQDANWPVAGILALAPAAVGAPLAPYVRRVLAGGDETCKYHLLETGVAQSQELTSALRSELERIAFVPMPSERTEDVCNVAREALEQ